jgi:tetratricopeptide (TPR) repeat protein
MHQDHQELLEQVARDLSNLTFWNDGFKSALKQIEESKRPSPASLDAISSRFQSTEAEVNEAVDRLKSAKVRLSEMGMFEIANLVDDLTFAKVGPGQIREKLAALAKSTVTPRAKARDLLIEIDRFNVRLNTAHELLRSKSVIPARNVNDLGMLTNLLDRGINAVPHVAYALGVVGIGAAVAIISVILGLNRLAFLAIVAMFVAMFLLYIFSRIEKSNDLVVKLAGQLVIVITALAFVAFVGSSVVATILCMPRVFVFLYGLEPACRSEKTTELIKPSDLESISPKSQPPAIRATEAQSPQADQVVVESFSVRPENDEELVWLKIKIERNLVDYFVEQGIPVTHPSSTLAISAPDPKRIVGEVERIPGGAIEIEVRLVEHQQIVAAKSAVASFEMWRENYKSIPEMMIYLLDLVPEKLTKRASPRRPTETATAALLYFEAARLAKMRQLDKASSALDHAISEDPKFTLPYWGKGQVLRAQGKSEEAEQWEKKAADIDEDHPRPNFVGDLGNPLPSLMKALQTSQWTTLRNRLSFKETAVPPYGIEIKAWAFYPADYGLDVITSESETGATVQELRQQSGAILAVNGGFFDIDQRSRMTPSGLLVVSNNHRIAGPTAKEKGGSGIVYERAGAIEIDSIDKFVMDSTQESQFLFTKPSGKLACFACPAARR